MNALDDTIYALSSGRPPAAIAIVRVSGCAAGQAVLMLAGMLPAPRRATLRTLRGDAGVLDHALVLWFPGPATATGEDLAEFHLHGGRAVVDAVLRALATLGLRMAEPGEFTRRALLNGRLSVSEVEGLADLLQAETESQRVEALRRSEGALGRMLSAWATRLVAVSARIEGAIDHDEAVVPAPEMWRPELASLISGIAAALAVPPTERLRDGIRVAIVGPPNAGKSTLFNALVGREAAIVSDTPGTTRDAIERPVTLAGRPILFIDTAGLRDTADPVETIGVDRARRVAEAADMVIDLEGPPRPGVIAVAAKADIDPPRDGALSLSAVSGQGMDELRDALLTMSDTLLPKPEDITFSCRYRDQLFLVLHELRCCTSEDDVLLVAEHLRTARTAMDALTGNTHMEDVWDTLFNRFCLGK